MPPFPATGEPLISLSDAATHLGVHTMTIRRMISNGIIPGYRLGPRALRVRLSDVESAVRVVPTAVA